MSVYMAKIENYQIEPKYNLYESFNLKCVKHRYIIHINAFVSILYFNKGFVNFCLVVCRLILVAYDYKYLPLYYVLLKTLMQLKRFEISSCNSDRL